MIVQELNVIKYTYTCDVCGETKTTETVIDSVVDDADAWKAAFGDLKFLNFEMKVYFYYDNDKVHTNHCIVTENAVYYHIEDAIEYYSVRGEDGLCTTYARTNSTDKFTKLLDTSDTYITAAQYETVISVSFADHFDKFTYDETTGAYTCADTITAVANDASGNPMMELSCFNINLLVADGKITKIASQYKIDANDDYSFEYYNIGLMELTVPSDVIENAVPESADNPFGGFGGDSNTEGEPVPAPDGENGANSEAVTPEN